MPEATAKSIKSRAPIATANKEASTILRRFFAESDFQREATVGRGASGALSMDDTSRWQRP